MAFTAPPARTALADVYPAPSNATFKAGAGTLHDYLLGLLGATGNPEDAFAAMKLLDPKLLLNLEPVFAVAANALTITWKGKGAVDLSAANPAYVMTRDAAVAGAGFNLRKRTGNVSLVLSAGSTLGMGNASSGWIYLYMVDNAATLEPAVSRAWYGEGGRVSTVAEGGAGGADSAANMYSTTARANVAFRFVTRFRAPQTVAGTWAALPTAVEPAGQGDLYVNTEGDVLTGALETADGSAAAPALAIGSGASGLYKPATNEVGVAVNGAEAMRWDASKRLLLGHTESIAVDTGAALMQVNYAFSPASFTRWSADGSAGSVTIGKARSGTIGTHGALQTSDVVGRLAFSGSDGTNFIPGAVISVQAESNWDGTDRPAQMSIQTTAPGASTPTTAIFMDSGQNVGMGETTPSALAKLAVAVSSATLVGGNLRQINAAGSALRAHHSSSSQTGACALLDANTAAGTGFSFLKATSDADGTPDLEFNLRGDGTAFADGSFTGSGADYQEFFEAHDLAGGGELEVGRTVVLVAGKVRHAAPGDSLEDVIGVVRPKADNKNSAMIGNAAWNHWSEKYLTDAYGRYLVDEFNVIEWAEVIPARTQPAKRQKTVSAIREKESIAIVEGQAVYSKAEAEVQELQWTAHLVYDTTGAPVIEVDKGRRVQLTHLEPVLEDFEEIIESERTVHHSYPQNRIPGGLVPPKDAVVKPCRRRRLNPAFDPEGVYVARSERAEWNLIGMLGQIQIKAGEPVNPRWRKMKEIEAGVELWFVR